MFTRSLNGTVVAQLLDEGRYVIVHLVDGRVDSFVGNLSSSTDMEKAKKFFSIPKACIWAEQQKPRIIIQGMGKIRYPWLYRGSDPKKLVVRNLRAFST